MKTLRFNKKGVTLLEGLIAMALLAMVALGTFSVLLSSSRRSSVPEMREETFVSIEAAQKALQTFSPSLDEDMVKDEDTVEFYDTFTKNLQLENNDPEAFWKNLEFNADTLDLNKNGVRRELDYMIPVVCGPGSEFTYTAQHNLYDGADSEIDASSRTRLKFEDMRYAGPDLVFDEEDELFPELRYVTFDVNCEGNTL